MAETGTPFAPTNPTDPLYRAALINPPDPSSSDAWNRWIPPLGLSYIASVARIHGFHVDLFDFSRDLNLSDALLSDVGLFQYPVFGISTYTEIWSSSVDLAQRLRRHAPQSVIVVGGYHATSVGEAILKDYPEFDIVVCNEGEEPFTELLAALAGNHSLDDIQGIIWRRNGGEIVRNPSRKNILKLDLLPHPARDFKYYPKRHWNLTLAGHRSNKATISLVSSRGCPKRCTFCSIIVLSPYYRMRSVESLMREIHLLYAEKPFGHIVFQDANFFVKVSRTLEFARTLNEFNPDITWSGTATADQVSQHADVLNEIGRLNCAFLEIGIESGNDQTLARLNKKTRVEHNEEALSLLARAGIGIGLDFIMFEPDMTFDDLIENVRFLHRNELFGYWPCEILFQEMRLFPGTPIREIHERRLGIEFNPHIVPVTPFYDPAVGAAWRCMQWYMSKYHMRVNQLMRDIIDILNRLLFNTKENIATNDELVSLCQQGHAMMVRLRHLPYHFLLDLMGEREALTGERSPEEIALLVDTARLDNQILEAERIKDQLVKNIEGTQLEDVAFVWTSTDS